MPTPPHSLFAKKRVRIYESVVEGLTFGEWRLAVRRRRLPRTSTDTDSSQGARGERHATGGRLVGGRSCHSRCIDALRGHAAKGSNMKESKTDPRKDKHNRKTAKKQNSNDKNK